MNWAAITFDWNQARAFLATAEEGSLSAAARALGQTQPTLGRQVAALEEELGLALFERVGRSLSLTPAGKDLMRHVAQMRDAAHRVALAAEGQSQTIEGKVMITASDIFSMYLLPPVLSHLRSIAPKLQIEVIASNDFQDLQRREADIAVRHIRPEQPELFARLIRQDTAGYYAAPAYLEARGWPSTVEDLASHDFVGFGDVDMGIDYLAREGIFLSQDNFALNTANGIVAWEFVLRGLGIGVMSDTVARRSPQVRRVLPQVPPITYPIWLTTHRDLQTSRRIRLVFDLLAEHLAEAPRA